MITGLLFLAALGIVGLCGHRGFTRPVPATRSTQVPQVPGGE